MSNKETIEGNWLIRKFLNPEYSRNGDWVLLNDEQGTRWNISVEKFHSSWDSLMPVVEKIETLTAYDVIGEVNYIVSIGAKLCIISQGGEGEIEYEQAETKIEATWKCCVKFITWYNNINTNGK